jgi:TrmH family RNA methyltransferase
VRLLSLARDLRRRKSRERGGLFVVEGVRATEELVKASLEVVGVIVAPKLAESSRGAALLAAMRARSWDIGEVDEREFRSAAETDSPQGVLAIARVPERSLDSLAGRLRVRILLLDAVQDPGNVGTLIRTAAALGADATVALPGTVDLWNAKVVRSAMGAHFHHPAFHRSWDEVAAFLAREGVVLWAADAGGDPVPASTDVPPRLAIAVGNEGSGLSQAVRTAAARVVSLPISPAVESLNVAVAAGILLHELRA